MPKFTPPERKGSAGNFRLAFQLLCILCTVAGLVAFAAGYLIAREERIYIVSLMDDEHQRKLELVVAATLDNLISEDVPQIETSMTQLINRDPNIRTVLLRNEAGKILYQYPDTEDGIRDDGENLRTFKKDIVFEGEKFGHFMVVWDTEGIVSEGRERAYRAASLIGLVCLCLGSMVYLFLRLFMIWPIQKVADEVKRIRKGDYDGQADDGPPRFVAAEIHDMAESVRSLRTHLIEKQIYENELSVAKDTAEQANRAKSDFLANISHELRTPLNAIIGFSDIMTGQMFGQMAERYLQYAGDIKNSGEHLLSLINDILDISRIEAGRLELNYVITDLPKEIDAATVLLRPMLEEKNIDLSCSIADEMPRVGADRQRIQQILLNLLSNAVKFTDAGGRITVSAQPDGNDAVRIAVSDTGIGIEAENIERILRPFEQIENAFTRQHAGSGLGLPITLALIESHGGTMRIDSVPGQGTTVIIRLPVNAKAVTFRDLDDPDGEENTASLDRSAPPLKRIA